jgi:hypothetical protein
LATRDCIFVSYRREDASADARSIYQALRDRFGREWLFIDVDTIERGADFRASLDNSLTDCKVLLAVIGRRWLDSADRSGKRRLDNPADFVRMELTRALEKKIVVIPVLVDGAILPSAEELPADIRDIAYRQAAFIRHETFRQDVGALATDLEKTITRKSPTKVIAVTGAAALAALVGGGLYIGLDPSSSRQPPPQAAEAHPAEPPAKPLPAAVLSMDEIKARCVTSEAHPDRPAVGSEVAERIAAGHFQYGWNDPSAGAETIWKSITAVEARPDGTVEISYDWRNGKLLLMPVVMDGYMSRSARFASTFEGAWRQTNGYGCIQMLFDDSGEAMARWSSGATTDYFADASIRPAP